MGYQNRAGLLWDGQKFAVETPVLESGVELLATAGEAPNGKAEMFGEGRPLSVWAFLWRG